MAAPSERGRRRPPAAALLIASACAVFIVYGSLFPFDFGSAARPLASVLEEWNPLRNRADAVDNIALFVPLGAALFFACSGVATRLAAAVAAWAVLGLGLQLLQLYLPGRVASLADAVNNAVGLTLGLMLAQAAAPWLGRRQLLGRSTQPLALLLVGFWYVYESFPLVPTLDVGLLAAHIRPLLAAPEFELPRLLRHALAAALGTLALLALRPLRSRTGCLLAALALLVGSEVLVPYGDLRIEALLGIVLGLAVGERLDRLLGLRARWAALGLAAAALLLTVATGFRGPAPASEFTWTPFSHLLWQGTTAGIPTAAFEALALGTLMWAGAADNRRTWRWPLVVIALAAVLEAVRLLLASGPADTSLVVTAMLLAPVAAASRRQPAAVPRQHSVDAAISPPPARPPATGATLPRFAAGRRSVGLQAALALAVLTLGLYLLPRLPAVPYNVVELFAGTDVVRLGLFAAALLWLGAAPWCIAALAAGRPAAPLWLPPLVVMAALVSLALLRMSVTQESLDDITGSTDLYRRVTADNLWGAAWRDRLLALPAAAVALLERGVRYTALYSVLLLPLTMAAIGVQKAWPWRRALPALGLLALCGWLAKWIVVDAAITDNLTELIARGGLPWLAGLALLFALHVALAAAPVSRRRAAALAVLTLAMLPLGWWLLTHGLEQVIVKYDSVWSAQQFLLGRNRSARLSELQLFLRWSVVYLALLGVCTLGMSLARRAFDPAPASRLAPASTVRRRSRHHSLRHALRNEN